WSWAAYWTVSSFRVLPAKRMQSPAMQLTHLVEWFVAFSLVAWHGFQAGWLGTRIVAPSPLLFIVGAGITAAGLAFAAWARVHLGENWSANITLKEGHRLIRSGPYAVARHPIYTGLLLGMLGTTIALDQVRGLLALAILSASLWRKLRMEEKWMREEFGEEYRQYQREVGALW
ncbi:MAG: isoprenylcysteine carboxylmethyltransferase family protein, partial [Pseudomonadota bacterium]